MNYFIEKKIYLEDMNNLILSIVSNVINNKKKSYYAINSDCMLKYWEDLEYRNIINSSENTVYVDGMGVIYAQKFLKLPIAKERIATTDLFPNLLQYINDNNVNINIYLLGGKPGTSQKVKQNFGKIFSNIKIVGTHHGYFENDEKIIEEINKLNIGILFVGFGTPIQEKWVEKNYHNIDAVSIITCGGLFDYYSGNVKRAPLFLQKIGLEWFYRLLQEPRRLFKRYVFGNMKYLIKVFTLRFNIKGYSNE